MLANKIYTTGSFRSLATFPPPIAIREDVGVDIVVSLLAYHGDTIIVMIINRFSKVAYFGMLPTNFFTDKGAEHFTNIFCKLHRYSKSIISNRDPIFLGKFWEILFHLNDTKLHEHSLPSSYGRSI